VTTPGCGIDSCGITTPGSVVATTGAASWGIATPGGAKPVDGIAAGAGITPGRPSPAVPSPAVPRAAPSWGCTITIMTKVRVGPIKHAAYSHDHLSMPANGPLSFSLLEKNILVTILQ